MSAKLIADRLGLQKEAEELRDELKDVADELDEHMKNVNIARVSGGTLGVAGGVTAAVGFALIPFTMGISALVAGVVGSAVAAVGGLTAGGASIVKIFIDKAKLKPLLEKWTAFQQLVIKEFEEREPELLKRMTEELADKIGNVPEDNVNASAAAAHIGMSASRAGAAGATTVGGLAARATAEGGAAVGGSAARVAVAAAAGSVVLNVVLIGLSLYDIIDGAIDLHKQKGSKAGDYLRSLAASLDELALNGLSKDYIMKFVSQ